MLRDHFLVNQLRQVSCHQFSAPTSGIWVDPLTMYQHSVTSPLHQTIPSIANSNLLTLTSSSTTPHVNLLLHEMIRRAASIYSQGLLYQQSAKAELQCDKEPKGISIPTPNLDFLNPQSLLKSISPELTLKDNVKISPPLKVSQTIEPTKCSVNQQNINKRKQSDQGLVQNRKKRPKALKKPSGDEKSPVSGILIKRVKKNDANVKKATESNEAMSGDIDSKYNVVDKSDESRKKLAAIQNLIGDFLCQLCKEKFDDAYCLAEHRCPSIIYIEYKCPECLKVFNCPANLASHRRWHRPRQDATKIPHSPTEKSTQHTFSKMEVNKSNIHFINPNTI